MHVGLQRCRREFTCHLLKGSYLNRIHKRRHLQGLLGSSGWRYGYDTVLMHRRIQGDALYMCAQFGVDGKLYVDVLGTFCLMAKHQNG